MNKKWQEIYENELSKQNTDYLSKSFAELEETLQYKFFDHSLLLMALTHSTYAYENKRKSIKDNERLEFLGDCVLDMIVGDLLFRENNDYKEGFMSKTRALIVCEATLSNQARNMNLGDYLILGKGEEQTDGRNKNSNLANAVESIIAAVYLDGGFDQAYNLVKRMFSSYIKQAELGAIIYDHKSKLLEYVQGIAMQEFIEFKIVKETGPDHARTFFAQVHYFDMIIGCGKGSTKKEAEQEAAKEAMVHIKSIKNPKQFNKAELKHNEGSY